MAGRPATPHSRTDDAVRASTSIVRGGGVPLRVQEFAPSRRSDSRADLPTLVMLHGLGEYGRYYRNVARRAALQGWRVVLPDHRGHGLSGGTRTHCRTFSDYARDLAAVWQALSLRDQRTVLAGHSMGGLIALRAVQGGHVRPAALWLASPLLRVRVHVPRSLLVIGKVVSNVWPRTRFSSRVREARRDPRSEVIESYEHDELVVQSVTARWFFSMRRALCKAWSEARGVDLPLRIVQAGDDDIVDLTATRPFLDLTSSPDRSYRLLPGRQHEILNEAGWEAVTDGLLDWAGDRLDSVETSGAKRRSRQAA